MIALPRNMPRDPATQATQVVQCVNHNRPEQKLMSLQKCKERHIAMALRSLSQKTNALRQHHLQSFQALSENPHDQDNYTEREGFYDVIHCVIEMGLSNSTCPWSYQDLVNFSLTCKLFLNVPERFWWHNVRESILNDPLNKPPLSGTVHRFRSYFYSKVCSVPGTVSLPRKFKYTWLKQEHLFCTCCRNLVQYCKNPEAHGMQVLVGKRRIKEKAEQRDHILRQTYIDTQNKVLKKVYKINNEANILHQPSYMKYASLEETCQSAFWVMLSLKYKNK